MADSSNPFKSLTFSPIPDSWEQEYDSENVFAWLTPVNDCARHAFHILVDSMITYPGSRMSDRKFIHLEGQEPMDVSSISNSDDEAEQGATTQLQWFGAFKFSTAVLPRDPAKGWFIGTGRGTLEVDVVIGPPDLGWKDYKVRGKHARLYIHKESCQPTVEAFHIMEVSGATGLKFISPWTASSSKVLEHGHKVEFGRCAYIFWHGEAFMNGMFKASLPKFMKAHHGESWAAHPILSATSTGSYLTMDQYTFSPGAFAAGSFGEVTAGWSQSGSAVAVKRFITPEPKRFTQHQKIMGLIGSHVGRARQMTRSSRLLTSRKPNIVELLHSSSDLEPAYPAIYCVYSPLAVASLENIIRSHTLNLPAQIALLMDYLRGLIYLHDEKGIMHRDIKPDNLGLRTLCPPRGIILDLDSATSEETSGDPGHGTVPYQAPEIINLRLPTKYKQPKYGRSVDVWALGVSAFCAVRAKHTRWSEYDRGSGYFRNLPGTEDPEYVLGTRLDRFHDQMEAQTAKSPFYLKYFDLLKGMTLYYPRSRIPASEALNRAAGLASVIKEMGKPAITPKGQAQGTKRKIGEVG